MKILAIRIRNLASLEETTEIDFTEGPLSTSGIFAITGPTGAGKSTILDALCLALYAQTPRYNKSNDPNQKIEDISGNVITQSDPRKILRDGATEGYAEVDFVGVDGNSYRAQWNVRRAKSKVEGALQADKVICKNLDTNIDAQGSKKELLAYISQKVGLSFDQFTRAVLLAQGDFTAFLKAPNSEKSELLEKLTGTQVYSEISKRIFEHHRVEKEELTLLTVQKEAISVLSDEELENLDKRKIEFIQLLKDQQKEVDVLAKEVAWYEKYSVLQQACTESTNTLELASMQKKEAAEREIKLTQVEQVQPARVWVQNLVEQKKRFTVREEKQKELEVHLLRLEDQRINEKVTLKTRVQNLELKVQEQEHAQPLLNQAKQLDIQLKDGVKQVEKTATELAHAKISVDEKEGKISKQQQRAEELKQTVKDLEAYAVQHQNRKSLAENDKLVLTALSNAQAILKEEQQAIIEIKHTKQLLEEKQAEEKIQSELLNRAREDQQNLESAYSKGQQDLSNTDITAIQQSKKQVDVQVMETIQAIADWKTFFEGTILYEKDNTALQTNKEELGDNQKKILDATKELESAQAIKEEAYKSLEIAKQELSENVVSLREQLAEGDPCSVCGSTKHPYALHDPRLDKVLNKLEDNFRQQELKHNQALTELSALQERKKQLEKEITRLSAEQLAQVELIKVYKENWYRFPLHNEAENRLPEEVSGWLKQQDSIHKQQQQKIQEQYDKYQEQQRELEVQKKRHESAIEKYRKTEDILKDIHRDINSQRDKLEQVDKDWNKAVQKLTQIRESLVGYFTNKDWFENWKINGDAFTEKIKEFRDQWKANMENLDKYKREQEVLAATIKGEENNRDLLADELSQKEKNASEATQNLQVLLEERKQLFEGRPVDEVEGQLKMAVDEAREELEQHKSQLEQLQTNITRITTQRDESKQELLDLSDEIKELDNKIIQWLATYNTSHNLSITLNEIENLLGLSNEWMETERKALQHINDTLLRAQTVLSEHQTALDKHRDQPLSDRTMVIATELLASMRAALKETTREDTEIKLRIRQDTENREKAGGLLDQIAAKEKVVKNWAMLNDVIGSADGKKFRQVAQEYTLDVLLGYTNVQLEMLSKRYLLQRIHGSLGLQVVDQDMGNEVRTVNSLSGGESFLVSLALALGLASLSSSRMQIESLFIDEGFGSLDPNTLDIAIDALDNLHNQGRKVGVISHVQEMTDRITTKIQVAKLANGKSKIEVIGFS